MSLDAPSTQTVHAGRLIARRLRASGIDTVFTLSGGHLFSIYDGCRSEGIRLIDTRHEQTATFAAEGWSKVTRVPGVAALTAGPGVTNGMSAMAAAQQNSVAAAGAGRPGPGAALGHGIAAGDRPRAVRGTAGPLRGHRAVAPRPRAGLSTKHCGRRSAPRRASASSTSRWTTCFPLSDDDGRPGALDDLPAAPGADPDAPGPGLPSLLSAAQRPVIMAGTNVWWGRGEAALLRLAEQRQIPVLMNGMARGVVPADHPLAFSRARSKALGEADVAAGRSGCRWTSGWASARCSGRRPS